MLVNCFLIAKQSGVYYKSLYAFLQELFESLLELGKNASAGRKRTYSHTFSPVMARPLHCYKLERMPTRRNCRACAGGRECDRPTKRVALGAIVLSNNRPVQRKTSHFGYISCQVNLCNKGPCFDVYYRIELS